MPNFKYAFSDEDVRFLGILLMDSCTGRNAHEEGLIVYGGVNDFPLYNDFVIPKAEEFFGMKINGLSKLPHSNGFTATPKSKPTFFIQKEGICDWVDAIGLYNLKCNKVFLENPVAGNGAQEKALESARFDKESQCLNGIVVGLPQDYAKHILEGAIAGKMYFENTTTRGTINLNPNNAILFLNLAGLFEKYGLDHESRLMKDSYRLIMRSRGVKSFYDNFEIINPNHKQLLEKRKESFREFTR